MYLPSFHLISQILYDFEQNNPLASDKLLETWPLYSEKLEDILRLHKLDADFVTMWPKDVEKFLMLLKLVRPVVKGPKTSATGVQTFNKTIDKLINLKQVSITRM